MHFVFFQFRFGKYSGDRYTYDIVGPHSLSTLDNAAIRVKRDISPSPPPPPSSSRPATVPANGVTVSNAASTAAAPAVAHQTDLPNVETPSRPLLGVNGTGQRKDLSTLNGTKPIALPPTSVSTLASPAQQPSTNAENKSSTINKSLGAPQPNLDPAIESELEKIQDTLIGDIDESEEAINKTVNEHLAEEHLESQVPKTDYFQYYNSTTVVDKNRSDAYWSQKKDYIISSILSKSHRRAIVSVIRNEIQNEIESSD